MNKKYIAAANSRQESLHALLSIEFREVRVMEVAPIDRALAAELLPRWAFRCWRMFAKLELIKDRYYFRFIANASV